MNTVFKMKKTTLIAIGIVWISALSILIISLTDLYPNTIFSKYRLMTGIAFLIISQFLKLIYNAAKIKHNA
ncbi:hypothetical protein [Tenacibaculum finnmarkense]|uniref:hypothetical protein n=2 Tax=Tenacibaculum finnmarkense TaxID=2781243 RepID=UPI00187B67DF|nr:hypothetical protein [Tenacibaculum finnmarkense]MCD8400877.1 hypothetical protein [Tenacibaculum finnmarkense genomovar ulcerans]MCD8423369.1 hypothetical protein [Tenacibaculum finnmarkense genomovar ulcerans]MCD8432401.1 hypothetical protein [Tenacibaculum finnmarkense genomovar ulcerans]MCG8238248.1 hypothetical protein [Tenacibaculum finnmarkense genomovar ulcerans]MCG8734398.1 hypothetical protein [Tenacibaculum finnmarkense]